MTTKRRYFSSTPLTLKQANQFISAHHRHHRAVTGHRFSIGALRCDSLVGVAICGRPVARMTDQYRIVEVTRLCVLPDTPNCCSYLYGKCARIANEMGFLSIQTFLLATEPGTTLRASGWEKCHETTGVDWDTPSRRRDTPEILKVPKVMWRKVFSERKGDS